MTPRVLVACEYSGHVREAFARRGWEAWSCDLLPSEQPSLFHHQGDVMELLQQRWDVLIGHPPCTGLTNAANKHLYLGKTKADKIALGYQRDEERWEMMREGAAFFNALWSADVPYIALENPVMNGHAAKLVGGKATQFIQPYEFGTPESKRTGLRLKNLPNLEPLPGWEKVLAHGKTLPKKEFERVHNLPPSPTRWKERSRTFPGVAQAMADQWGPYVEEALTMAVAA
jgi:hypothetical protein